MKRWMMYRCVGLSWNKNCINLFLTVKYKNCNRIHAVSYFYFLLLKCSLLCLKCSLSGIKWHYVIGRTNWVWCFFFFLCHSWILTYLFYMEECIFFYLLLEGPLLSQTNWTWKKVFHVLYFSLQALLIWHQWLMLVIM